LFTSPSGRKQKEQKKNASIYYVRHYITIITVCTLVVIATHIEMPTAVRILLIAFAAITALQVREQQLRWRST
jgi:hypothetical protein